MRRRPFRVYSWNVNGLRACANKGFVDWLAGGDADVVGLQETRARAAQLPPGLREPEGWHARFVSAERPGYSGVALYSRRAPDAHATSLDVDEFDVEGRFQLARFGRLWVANVYFPNGSGPGRDHSRVPYKLAFYRRVFEHLEPLRAGGEPVVVIGDYNTAREPIDLARPKQNTKTSGFLPEERAELDRWIDAGWIDTFRHFEPAGEHYTWWSQRGGVRERNVGWRIDYALASPGAARHLRAAAIHPDVFGSDHCPIRVDLDPAVL
ncbi:MAG: exodeoxyribonuclease III [Myxococcales bacterium]|nr:exodeoxyribonuclease III [Myxococcales bacterium]